MIYIVVGVICLILAIVSGVVVAMADKPKGKMSSMVTTGLVECKEVNLSEALENLVVCNGINDKE